MNIVPELAILAYLFYIVPELTEPTYIAPEITVPAYIVPELAIHLPILVVVRSDSESESRRTPPTQ